MQKIPNMSQNKYPLQYQLGPLWEVYLLLK